MNAQKKNEFIIYLILLLLFIGLVVFLSIKYAPDLIRLVRSSEEFNVWLSSYAYYQRVLIFIFLQALQVVIAAIPGEFVQIAGGYVFGIVQGTLYSVAGILSGSVLAFTISRFVGYPLVRIFVSANELERFTALLRKKRAETVIFLLFLIPGIPKDILVYIAGITPINPWKFFSLFLLGRLPAMIGASIIGTNIYQEDYLTAGVILGISALLFFIGYFYKDKIIKKVHKFQHRKERQSNHKQKPYDPNTK